MNELTGFMLGHKEEQQRKLAAEYRQQEAEQRQQRRKATKRYPPPRKLRAAMKGQQLDGIRYQTWVLNNHQYWKQDCSPSL